MKTCASLAALEIGGGNGMISLITGASTRLDIPIVDGDFMVSIANLTWERPTNPIIRAEHTLQDGKPRQMSTTLVLAEK
jgi:hypothetical protein